MEWTIEEWSSRFRNFLLCPFFTALTRTFKAFKHIFTSPSSVDQEPKATRSGNARIHGMHSVTKASIAYVATQVCSFFCI